VNPFKSLAEKVRRRVPGYVEGAVLDAVGKLDVSPDLDFAVAADLNATGVLNAADSDLLPQRFVEIKLGDHVFNIPSPEVRRLAENVRNAATTRLRVDSSLIPSLELGDYIKVDHVPYRVVEIRKDFPEDDTLELHLSANVLEEKKPEELPEDKIDIMHELNQ